ncbi:hypothetical protein [Nocardioides sp. B-3]|uniref:hypothetical protein n=1 Tax=Nocardioides sp. B-3 TaxID=2895565 RepID=UPI002152B4B5|nr:hypothetical protein [Nocardioides sp. B-3]UUZ60444.1 hypothetical protein LP418_06000 [Nocardioides sp. B-3]
MVTQDRGRPDVDAGWQPVARSRAHELVISRIEEQILSGALVVGDALPPERDRRCGSR